MQWGSFHWNLLHYEGNDAENGVGGRIGQDGQDGQGQDDEGAILKWTHISPFRTF